MNSKPSRRDVTHQRIVEVAAQTLRSSGFESVGVADVMKQAGLTHGGFYAHFSSRDALLAEALDHAGHEGARHMQERMRKRQVRGRSEFQALVESYLSDAHLQEPESGCVVAAVSSEMHRQTPALAKAAAGRVNGLIALVREALGPEGTQEQAMLVVSSLVGTLQIARALGPGTQRQQLLRAARATLLAQYAPS